MVKGTLRVSVPNPSVPVGTTATTYGAVTAATGADLLKRNSDLQAGAGRGIQARLFAVPVVVPNS